MQTTANGPEGAKEPLPQRNEPGVCHGRPLEAGCGASHKSGVRREARHHIPGAAGKHSKEVLGSLAYPRPKGQRDKSMLGKA